MQDRSGSAPSKRDSPDPNANLIKIFDTEHESEALVVNRLLDSTGIDSDITSIEAVQDTFPGVDGTVILVRGEDAARARPLDDDVELTGV